MAVDYLLRLFLRDIDGEHISQFLTMHDLRPVLWRVVEVDLHSEGETKLILSYLPRLWASCYDRDLESSDDFQSLVSTA